MVVLETLAPLHDRIRSGLACGGAFLLRASAMKAPMAADKVVAQVSKPAVSPISKSAAALAGSARSGFIDARRMFAPASRFGNLRYGRLGGLRYVQSRATHEAPTDFVKSLVKSRRPAILTIDICEANEFIETPPMSKHVPIIVWLAFFLLWTGSKALAGLSEITLETREEGAGMLADVPKIVVHVFAKSRKETLEVAPEQPGVFRVFPPEYRWTRLDLEAAHEGYAFERARLRAEHSPERLVLSMKPGRTVGGRVMNRRGEACPNSRVLLTRTDANSKLNWIGFDTPHVETSDADGDWSCSHFPEFMEGVEIRIQSNGCADTLFRATKDAVNPHSKSRVSMKSLLNGDAVFFMDDPMPVSGGVSGPDGRPLEGVRAHVGGQVTWTASDGRFRFDTLPEGSHVCLFQAHGYAAVKKIVHVRSKGSSLNIEMRPIEPISVWTVDPSGDPLAGVFVSIPNWDGLEIEDWRWFTDEQGGVEWDSPPVEGGSFAIYHPDFKQSTVVNVRPGESREAVLSPLFRLNLKVVDAETGLPASRGRVWIGHLHENGAHWSVERTWDNPTGVLSVPIRDPRLSRRVRIEAEGYGDFTATIVGSGASEQLRAELIPLKAFEGRVVDFDHRPMEGARAAAIESGGHVHFNGKTWEGGGLETAASSDENGRFAVQTTSRTAHLAVSHADGFALSRDRMWAEDALIQLQPWGRVACRIEPELLSGSGLILGLQSMPDFPIQLHPHAFHKLSPDSGFVEFEKVPSGMFRLGVLDSSGWIRFTLIRVEPGETSHARMKSGGARLKGEISMKEPPAGETFFMGHLIPAPFKDEDSTPSVLSDGRSGGSSLFQHRLEFVSRAAFQTDHVLAGDYELELHCHARLEADQGGAKCLGISRTAIRVGEQDEIDLGTIPFEAE